MKPWAGWLVAGFGLALPMAAGAAQVVDLAAPAATVRIEPQHVAAGAVETAADGVAQRRYTFAPAPAPALTLAPAQGTWDWRGQGELHLRVQNAMPWAVTLDVVVDSGTGRQLRATVGLPAGPAQMLVLPLAPTSPLAFGMQKGPARPFDDGGTRVLLATTVVGQFDAAAVHAVRVSMPAPQAPQSILLGRLDTVPGTPVLHAAYTGIVDRYGQYTREEWPEKIASDAALRAAVKRSPAAAPTTGEDRYGGRLGVRLSATGWFHTQKSGGRWWLVTPDGHGFFSLGVDATTAEGTRTYVQGREAMFRDLPPDSGAFAAFHGSGDSRDAQRGAGAGRCCDYGRWFDFYAANLYRVDGQGWLAAWRTRTLARLKAWGFNTLADWSDPALGAMHQLPYTRELDIRGEVGSVSTGRDLWGRMPDPFDPRFAPAVDAAAAEAAQGVRNDPWLLGYFAGNELSWAAWSADGRWALAIGTLRGEARSAAKQAFIADLKKKYATPGKLASAWGIALPSWTALEATNFPAPTPNAAHPAIAADYSAWLSRYAERFFRTVAEAIHRHDPHHLYLGSRFAMKTPEAVAMCAKYCDVVSFNVYADLPQHGFDAAAMRQLDKPVLISEFSFGSDDRGPFGNGVVSVETEAQRGVAYAHYLRAAASDPDIVGVHWFEYVDEPVTGRLLDGENSHFGLVGVTDIPFAGFVEAVRKANESVRH